jgi:glycosyltransferase involved in cell wall biosynthesis
VTPLVSCLMVTANRASLARRAIQCFLAQTWSNRELIIVDDGCKDYRDMLANALSAPSHHVVSGGPPIRYERIAHNPARRLGELRNMTLDLARGDYCTQWDDDEWYHPERIERQLAALESGRSAGACVLRDTLMHLATPDFAAHPYRTGLRNGTPGTILHRRTTVRYPNVSKGEDSLFRQALSKTSPVVVLADQAHLFIRCFHGKNTWDRRHFVERLHYTWRDKVAYAVAVGVRRDLFTHPAFRLNAAERASTEAFLDQSRRLELL